VALFEILAIVLGGGAIIGLASHFLVEPPRARQLLRRAPRRMIDAFKEGEAAKIVGTLSYLGEPLRTPLTGRPCACYEILVEEYSATGGMGSWEVVIREFKGQDFMLRDETGLAIVSPEGAELEITLDSQTKSGTFHEPTVRETNFLKSHGRKGKGWLFNKTLRYREGVLEAGEFVAVLGQGVNEPDPDGADQVSGYRQGPPMRLRLGGSKKTPLMISDAPETLR